MEEQKLWYDVFDGEKMISTTHDEKAANRRAFAENSSYRKAKDRTWQVKVRDTDNAEIFYMKGRS
jgi:hypothetical protein